MRSCALAAGVLALALTAFPAEPAWPQFRGPRGDGTSLASRVPVVWGEGSNVVWRAEIPGRGRSSPVVLGDSVWVTTALEQGVQRTRIGPDDMQTAERVELEAVCVSRADGRLVWRTSLFAVDQPDPVHWLNSWATPTPVAEEGRLYCDFGTFGTACLDAASGKVVWKERLPLDHQVGPGSSPVLWRDLMILVRDGRDAQYVAALDKRTGRTVWRTERPPIQAGSPNLKKSFVTPLLVAGAGQDQLVSPGAHWVAGYDPATGRELWRLRHGEGFSIGSCPTFGHGYAFFSTGCFKAQLWAVRIDGTGEVTATHAAWKTLRQVPVMSSPVLAGDELYWVSDEGMATCADARSGEIHWQERLGGSHLASVLHAEGRLYFVAQDGRATVLRAGRTFARLAENTLPGPVIATPAIVDSALLIRSDSALYWIGTK